MGMDLILERANKDIEACKLGKAYVLVTVRRGGRDAEQLPSIHTFTGEPGLNETEGLRAFHCTYFQGAFELWARPVTDGKRTRWVSTNKVYEVISIKKLSRSQYLERLEKMKPPYHVDKALFCHSCGKNLLELPLTFSLRDSGKDKDGRDIAYCSRICRGDKQVAPTKNSADLRAATPPTTPVAKPGKSAPVPTAMAPKKAPSSPATAPRASTKATPGARIFKVSPDGMREGSRRWNTYQAITEGESLATFAGDKGDLGKMLKNGQVRVGEK